MTVSFFCINFTRTLSLRLFRLGLLLFQVHVHTRVLLPQVAGLRFRRIPRYYRVGIEKVFLISDLQ